MTVGVVIRLPEPLASRICEIRARYRVEGGCHDPAAIHSPPHVTLLSLVPSQGRWEEIVTHLGEVARRHSPFEVSLESPGTFLPVSPVAYLSVGRGSAELATLADDVRSGPLEGIAPYDYVPHVTLVHPGDDALLRRVERELKEFRDAFTVVSMGLYQQIPSGRWVHREEIPLGTNPQAVQHP